MAVGVYGGVPRVELVVFFLVGLLGGAHCLGMCGPLVSVYAGRVDDGRGATFAEIRQHFLFNAGRTAAYALVGGTLGGLGALAFDAAAVAGAVNATRAVVGVVVGLVVVGVGVSYLRGGVGGPLARLETAGAGGLVARASGLVDEWTRGPRILGMGALHAALPCPLLYPAYLYALARGNPAEGAIVLGALGVGTFPTLFAYGTAFGAAPGRWRHRAHRALGVAFLAMGYLPLSHGLALLGVPVPLPPVHDLIYQPLDLLFDAAQYCLPG